MSQIMYNYPAMLAHSADMAGYAGTLQGLGTDIASEQAALSAGWQGDTGMSYQAWQAQWNQAMEQLVLAYGRHPRKQHHLDAGPRPSRRRQMGRLSVCHCSHTRFPHYPQSDLDGAVSCESWRPPAN
jgi:ESAT-6 family protein